MPSGLALHGGAFYRYLREAASGRPAATASAYRDPANGRITFEGALESSSGNLIDWTPVPLQRPRRGRQRPRRPASPLRPPVRRSARITASAPPAGGMTMRLLPPSLLLCAGLSAGAALTDQLAAYYDFPVRPQ
ncbi:MAG: hypothetical protein U1G05_09140 [Kiritimatiellia bacterium]